MGVVFQAVDPTIGRTVAIKTIRLGDVTNAQERAKLRERLFREARSAGILSHPNIVTIYDMQEEGDMTYIAMEYVDGPTLDALMSGNEPVAPGRSAAHSARRRPPASITRTRRASCTAISSRPTSCWTTPAR